jgi:hypothetical protein
VVLAQAFKKLPALRTGSVGALADAVGHAYGLSGDHTAWARTREADLTPLIDAKLPELMALGTSPAKKNASDDFFGESSALGEVADTVGFAAPPVSVAQTTTRTLDDIQPVGVPARSSNVLILVGAAALILGVVVVIAFVLLS